MTASVHLGLGLIGIGRPWPQRDAPVPAHEDAVRLITTAYGLGVRYFDTAPAYGLSEQRLADALRGPLRAVRSELTIATKCGEQWSRQRGSIVAHEPHAILESVHASHEVLGRIDVLQLHKANPSVVQDIRVLQVLAEAADRYAIPKLGVSAGDKLTCQLALDSKLFSVVQCPLNVMNRDLASWVSQHSDDIVVVTNRPFGSGRLLREGLSIGYMLQFVRSTLRTGVILTGTTDIGHLAETMREMKGLE